VVRIATLDRAHVPSTASAWLGRRRVLCGHHVIIVGRICITICICVLIGCVVVGVAVRIVVVVVDHGTGRG